MTPHPDLAGQFSGSGYCYDHGTFQCDLCTVRARLAAAERECSRLRGEVEALRGMLEPLARATVQYDRMFGVMQFSDLTAEAGDLATWRKRAGGALARDGGTPPGAVHRPGCPNATPYGGGTDCGCLSSGTEHRDDGQGFRRRES